MRIAAHGVIADGGGSGAGSFPVVFRELLVQGHELHFYGVPAFSRVPSLEHADGYHYHPMRLASARRLYNPVQKLGNQYVIAALAQYARIAYQREAIRLIELDHRSQAYDFVLCLDAVNLWQSRLPVLSWPQSPPQSEWAALRRPPIRRLLEESSGKVRAHATDVFYATRWVEARLALGSSDAMLCGSAWAKREWVRFGLPEERAETLAYAVPGAEFARVPPPGTRPTTTYLWLGRAVPRKRLDLFLAAFERVHCSDPNARALLLGNLGDRASQRLLDARAHDAGITVLKPVARSEVPHLFERADVLVQPSENENFGFGVAEALAAGRPVVLGATNGTRDYCGDALFGFETYAPESIADAMLRARDAVRTGGAGLAAAARAAAQSFEPGAVTRSLIAAAERAIARKHGRGV
jgi:glycosyltransferase involved in cell wall biosynthesis